MPATIKWLEECGITPLVVDGGSDDRTLEVARSAGIASYSTAPGRAKQMNFGAARATGDILFFLHADSQPPRDCALKIMTVLINEKIAAGAFHLNIDSRDIRLRVISALANLRSHVFKLPYGDQGLFVRRRVFEKIGGFRNIPLMEDVEIIDRLKQEGRIVIVNGTMKTSARRWLHRGPLKNSVVNLFRLIRYRMGASPEALAREYRNIR